MLSELELEILNLETKYNKGEFTGADYLALADAYSRAGDIRKQRDMLEQDYRLYEDADAFSTLQGLSVNLEEETEEIRSRAQEMLNDLELPEYLDERTAQLLSGAGCTAAILCAGGIYRRGTAFFQSVVYRK